MAFHYNFHRVVYTNLDVSGVWPWRRLLNFHAQCCFKLYHIPLPEIDDYFAESQESDTYDADLMAELFEPLHHGEKQLFQEGQQVEAYLEPSS